MKVYMRWYVLLLSLVAACKFQVQKDGGYSLEKVAEAEDSHNGQIIDYCVVVLASHSPLLTRLTFKDEGIRPIVTDFKQAQECTINRIFHFVPHKHRMN